MEDFVKSLIEQMYVEVVGGNQVYAIYPGRFHPPGPHHYQAYKWLTEKFGKNNVFITTSDKVDPPNSPLSFEEKKKIWLKYGVPENRIVKVKMPYQSSEVLNSLPQGSVAVFGFGKKDADRFDVGRKKKDGSPSYLQYYENNENKLEDYTKHGYLIVVPHFSLKVNGKELSGSEIRELLMRDKSRATFEKVFGWYDPAIQAMLNKSFSTAKFLQEGGNVFDEEVSMVKKENLDQTIKNVLRQYGLEKLPYSKIGNFNKPLLGDIDIAIDTADILKFLGLPPNTPKDEMLKKLEERVKNVHVSKGLYQFHLLGVASNQRFIDKSGKEENKTPYVQVDVMLGNRKWREQFFSGAGEGSQYKAKFRNRFITEIVSKIIENVDGTQQKYLLSPGEGFFLQKFTVDQKGKRQEISRELKAADMDFVAKFLFGQNKTFKDIDTFEKVYTLFKSPEFRFPKLRNEILAAFKETTAQIQKTYPDMAVPKINEGKLSIKRFSGANSMTDSEFLSFLRSIQPLVKNGRLDLSVSDTASVTEKLDGSPCNWGINKAAKFFMESANSGEITAQQVERFNNPYTIHFYEAFKFLSGYKPFQTKLKSVLQKHGAFKVVSEMFPLLTHKGDEFGDVVFCSTKYSKNSLGNKGAFVCLDASCEKMGSRGTDMILKDVEMPSDTEWKVYNVHTHGKLSKNGLVFDLVGIRDLVSSPQKLSDAETIIKSKKESPEKDALKKVLTTVKQQMQNVLNQYSEKIDTFLQKGGGRKYPVEGVVLKIDVPDNPIFVKGTSEIFHKIADVTWGTRHAAGDAEKVLEGKFLTDVLGLTTAHSATINKAVAASKAQLGMPRTEDDINKIASDVYQKLRSSTTIASSEKIKNNARVVLLQAKTEVSEAATRWAQITRTNKVDPDTITKTENSLRYVNDKIKKIEDALVNTHYIGDSYVVYLLRIFLDKRILSHTEME